MFERYTDKARRVVVFAQDEARDLRHNNINTMHILLGLIREEEGIAAKVIAELGLDYHDLRGEIPAGTEEVTGHIPFTPAAKKVLERALREALQLGHSYIGTEHILLALTHSEDGDVQRVLHLDKLTPVRFREAVIEYLHGKMQQPTVEDLLARIERLEARQPEVTVTITPRSILSPEKEAELTRIIREYLRQEKHV